MIKNTYELRLKLLCYSFLAILLSSIVLSIIQPTVVSAATSDPASFLKMEATYAFQECMVDRDFNGNPSNDNVSSREIFAGNSSAKKNVSAVVDADDYVKECKTLFGNTLQALGISYNDFLDKYYEANPNNSDQLVFKEGVTSATIEGDIIKGLKEKSWFIAYPTTDRNNLSALYVKLALLPQFEYCYERSETASGDQVFTVDGETVAYNHRSGRDNHSDIAVGLLIDINAQHRDGIWSCGELADYMRNSGEFADGHSLTDILLGSVISDEEYQSAQETVNTSTGHTSEGEEGDECKIGIPFIGDLFCKAVKLIFEGISKVFEKVINFFADSGKQFDRLDRDPSFKTSWESIRNIANIIFIFAFLVVIFQYLTNINVVDAYFVKKFIPRLLIAVILVQASWWITKEMNAIFSDLGQSIQTIVLQGGGAEISLTTGDGAVANIAAGALVGFSFLGPVAAIVVAAIIGLILLLILLVTIIILALREVLLVLLALLAPLAFASFAFPQLENSMKKWFNAYIKLLLIYPIMQLFLTLGVIIGNALNSMGGIYELFGLIAWFLPFFLLPFTFKMSGSMLGKVVDKGRQWANKGQKMAVNKGKEAYGRSNFAMDRKNNKAIKDGDRQRLSRNRTLQSLSEDPTQLTGVAALRSRMRRRGLSESALQNIRGSHEAEQLKEGQQTLAGANLGGLDRADRESILGRVARGERVEYDDASGTRQVLDGNDNNVAYAALSRMEDEQMWGEVRSFHAETFHPDGSVRDGMGERAGMLRNVNQAHISDIKDKVPDLNRKNLVTGVKIESMGGWHESTWNNLRDTYDRARASGDTATVDNITSNIREFASLDNGAMLAKMDPEARRAFEQRLGYNLATLAGSAPTPGGGGAGGGPAPGGGGGAGGGPAPGGGGGGGGGAGGGPAPGGPAGGGTPLPPGAAGGHGPGVVGGNGLWTPGP